MNNQVDENFNAKTHKRKNDKTVHKCISCTLSLCCFDASSLTYGRVSMIQVRYKKRMGTDGLAFYHLSPLRCLDQIMVVAELSQHLVRHPKLSDPLFLEVPDGWEMLK